MSIMQQLSLLKTQLEKYKTQAFLKRLLHDIKKIEIHNLNDDSCQFTFIIPAIINQYRAIYLFEMIPLKGVYKNQRFSVFQYFRIEFETNYPYEAPELYCVDNVQHPNKHFLTKQMYLPSLQQWSPVNNFYTLLVELKETLIEPNFQQIPNYHKNVELAIQVKNRMNNISGISMIKQQRMTEIIYHNFQIDKDQLDEKQSIVEDVIHENENSYARVDLTKQKRVLYNNNNNNSK